jgi:hypothetical protein
MEKMKALNESFVKESHKMNEESGELAKTNENAFSFYTTYMESFQKLSKLWMELVWGPFFFRYSNTRQIDAS